MSHSFKIRHGVFETNSSSSHSVTIKGDSGYSTIVPNHDGDIVLEGGEFGWEYKKTNDPLAKANYCAVLALKDEEKMALLHRVIIDQTKAGRVVVFATEESASKYWSYIDHQAVERGIPQDIFASEQSLRDFIFGKSSWLFTGNDNVAAPPNFYDEDGGLSKPFKLLIHGNPTSAYLSSDNNHDEIEGILRGIIGRDSRCSASHRVWPNNGFEIPWGKGKFLNLKDRKVCLIKQKYDKKKDKYVQTDTLEIPFAIVPNPDLKR